MITVLINLFALVAQVDRATGFYPVGYVFESHREYNYPTIQYYNATIL